MELCKENLMRHIFQNPKNVPAKLPSSTPTIRTTIQWAKDIANGLEYIHKQGYVHRDLKLENILVRKQDVSVLLGLINCTCRWLYLRCAPLVLVLESESSRPGARFLKVPTWFCTQKAVAKSVSNLMITELFYSHIRKMNRGSLYTISFTRILLSVFRQNKKVHVNN